jgi:hypothetical protein
MKSKKSLKVWAGLSFLVFVGIWFLPWRFATNDDLIMMWLVSGAYTGTPEAYAVFIHPFLSWALSRLYGFYPTIHWYPIFWFVTLYLSFVAIVLSVINSSISASWQRLLLFSVLILWIHFSFFLQFTVVAGAAGFSGFLVFEKNTQHKSKAYSIVALVLMCCSILIRWESFVLIALGFGVYLVFFQTKQVLSTKFKSYLPILFLFLGFFLADYLCVTNSTYSDFNDYTKARAAVFDHPAFHLLKIENRLDFGSDWFFFSYAMMDGNDIDIARLTSFKHQLDETLYSGRQIVKSLERLRENMRFQNFKAAFSLIFCLIFLFVYRKKSHKYFFLLFWIGFMLVFNHFFIVNPRVYILFFLPILFPIIFNGDFPNLRTPIFLFIYLLLSSLLLIHIVNLSADVKRRRLIANEVDRLIKDLKVDQLIIFEGPYQHLLPMHYNPSNPAPFISMGWISKSPFQIKALNKFGMDKLEGNSEFYALGLDVDDDYYLDDYMSFLGYNYYLKSKTMGQGELILFHYILR